MGGRGVPECTAHNHIFVHVCVYIYICTYIHARMHAYTYHAAGLTSHGEAISRDFFDFASQIQLSDSPLQPFMRHTART